MKYLSIFGLVIVSLSACVPAKKYNELVEREKICSEELNKYKASALENEAKAKDLQVMADQLRKEVIQLKKDTLELDRTIAFYKLNMI